MDKIIITCAVTGAETTRAQNQNLPISPEEIAGSAHEAALAGAAILHLHVRDAQGLPTQNRDIFRETIALVRAKTDMVIEVTTGGAAGMSLEERLQPLALNPEMASLDCGTVNFGDECIVNTLPMVRKAAAEMKNRGIRPTLECFDLSHIEASRLMIQEGLIEPPFHYGIVLNYPGGVRYDLETLNFFVKRLPAGAFWTAIGVGGRGSLEAMLGAIAGGGFIRVGFEDNIYYGKGVPAKSNAQLVERAVRLVRESGREPATASEVRGLFKLKKYQGAEK